MCLHWPFNHPMFKISISHSLTSDAKVAATAMATRALRELGIGAPTAALLFSTFGNDHARLLKELVQLLPGCPIVGGSSNGEVSLEQGYRVGSSVLIVFASDTITFRAGVLRDLTFDNEAQNLEMALQQWRAQGVAYQPGSGKSPGLPVLGLLFPDGLGLDGASIVGLFSDHFVGTRFFGGASAENFTLTQTVQFFNNEVLHNAVPYLLFYGPLRCHWAVTEGLGSGWHAVGDRMDAQCNGTFIQTIAQKPAVEYLASRYRLQGGQLSVCHPFVIYPNRDSNEHYLRDVIRYCEETGQLESVQSLPTDCQIQLTQPDVTDILAVSKKNIHEALAHFPRTKPPVAALWFSCVSRALVLENNAADEFKTATETIPSCLPVAGFYTYGEIAPSGLLGQNAYHGSTLVTLLLGEEPVTDTGIFNQHHQFSASHLALDNPALAVSQAKIQNPQRDQPVQSPPEILHSTFQKMQGQAYALIHDMLQGLSVHGEVRDFLLSIWSNVLALTMMHYGPHHANTLAMQKAANELLWISGAKTTRRKRFRVINDVKLLLQQLRAGMTLIGLSIEQQQSYIDVISTSMVDAFLSGSGNSKPDKSIPPQTLGKPAESHNPSPSPSPSLVLHHDVKGLNVTEMDDPPDSVWRMFDESNAHPPDIHDRSEELREHLFDTYPQLTEKFDETHDAPSDVNDPFKKFPEHLLDKYPQIKENIVRHWGTVKLEKYLSLILENNRDQVRSGFSLDVADFLLKLYYKNIACLESKNIRIDDYDLITKLKWQLPKNF